MIDQSFPCEDPSHPRCSRARGGDWTCDAGHLLDDDDLCEVCDCVLPLASLGKLLEALLRAGCAPKRVGSRG